MDWENCSYLQSTWEPEDGLAHAQRHLTAYQKKSRQVEIDVASVLLEDPTRLGARLRRDVCHPHGDSRPHSG